MWSSDLEVLPLSCGNCGKGLSGLRDDIIYFCPDCRLAWSLDHEAPVPIRFAALASSAAPDLHLPFWMVRAEVGESSLLLRDEHDCSPLEYPRDLDPAAGRNLTGKTIPTGRILLAVPAFACDRAAGFGWEVTRMLDSMPEGDFPVLALPGGVLGRREAEELSKAVFLAGQAERHPGLAFADINLEAVKASIAAVGFNLHAHGLQLAGARLMLPYTAMADSRALIDFLGLTEPSG